MREYNNYQRRSLQRLHPFWTLNLILTHPNHNPNTNSLFLLLAIFTLTRRVFKDNDLVRRLILVRWLVLWNITLCETQQHEKFESKRRQTKGHQNASQFNIINPKNKSYPDTNAAEDTRPGNEVALLILQRHWRPHRRSVQVLYQRNRHQWSVDICHASTTWVVISGDNRRRRNREITASVRTTDKVLHSVSTVYEHHFAITNLFLSVEVCIYRRKAELLSILQNERSTSTYFFHLPLLFLFVYVAHI